MPKIRLVPILLCEGCAEHQSGYFRRMDHGFKKAFCTDYCNRVEEILENSVSDV